MIDIEQMIKNAVEKAFKTAWSKMALGGPGDTMDHSDIRDNTDFGQLLHKEGLWSLYKYKKEKSLLYHLCRGYSGMQQSNNPVRPVTGGCTACDSEAPDEIRGLWTLHNFDWIQRSGGE